MLIIGGTGIVGAAVARLALEREYRVVCLADNQKLQLPQGVEFIQANKRSKNFAKVSRALTKKQKWDVIVDVLSYTATDARVTYESFKEHAAHFFILSTTLVYDRYGQPFSYERIRSDHSLAKKGVQGGYVDHKLEMEAFWKEHTDINWTILRPYHILGSGSWLGCIPPLNREPRLVEMIQGEEIIQLADGGRMPINIVHPRDLGEVIIRAAQQKQTFHKCYNAVNPEEIIARDYFEEIAGKLGKPLRVHSIPSEHAWHFEHEWQLTTLPHLYDVSDLQRDIGYVPSTSLSECIKDAIKFPQEKPQKRSTQVHKFMNLKPEPRLHRYYQDSWYLG